MINLRAVALALIFAAATAPGANAESWQRITTADGSSTDQVGLARTADGTLHVAWHHPTGPNTEDLLHTEISPAGKVGVTSPIQSGWTGFTNPALVVVPGGLRAFWGGFRTTDSSDPQKETNTALSADGGTSWALHPGSVVPSGAQSYASDTAATVLPNGSTLQSFAGTSGTWVHSGLSPTTANHDFQAPLGQYGFDPNLATDVAGRTVLAWYSNAVGHLGVKAQDVAADGSPIGSASTMPETDDEEVRLLARTPLAARTGGGFYVAYPDSDLVRLWRVGTTDAPVIGRTQDSSTPAVAVAAAGDGRLWVVWTEGFGDPDVLARRSNAGATKFGAIVNAGHPDEAVEAYKVDASAAGGALDVLGHFNIDNSADAATSYGRLLPGLTLRANPRSLRAGKKTAVDFTVSDAGDAVAGAKVKVLGASGKTNGRGRVTLEIKSGTTVKASAASSGYTRVRKSLRVRGG